MKKSYFKETVRQLLLPALALLIISLLIAVNYILLDYSSPIKIHMLHQYDLFNRLMSLLTPVILMVVSFSFSKDREKLDFYDALPLSRQTFFMLRVVSVFVVSVAVFMIPFVFSAVTVIYVGVPITFYNVLSELLSAIRYTAIATGLSAISVIAFKKPFMTFVGAFEMIFVLPSFFSTMITLINRKLPSFGLYDESPAINFNSFPEAHTLFDGKQVALSITVILIQIILSVAAVYGCMVYYKNNSFNKKMNAVWFYLTLFLPCVLIGVVWQTTLDEIFGYIVIAVLVIICFVPIIIKYRSLKHLVQSGIVFFVVIGITYLLMYRVPKIYSDYNYNTPVLQNEIKSIEIVDGYSQFLESGMKTTDKTLFLDFLTGVTDGSVVGNTIIKIERERGLPLYRYARYESESEIKIHDALVGAEQIIKYIEAARNNRDNIWFDYDGPTNVRLNNTICNAYIDMLKALPEKEWYEVRIKEKSVKMLHGQNSFKISADGLFYYINPVTFPEFFDIINEHIDESEFITALETGDYIGKYQISGYRLNKPLTDEVKTIILNAMTRDISEMIDKMGEDEFKNGGVWAIETLSKDFYDGTPQDLKCHHLLPLTESECKTLIEFFE